MTKFLSFTESKSSSINYFESCITEIGTTQFENMYESKTGLTPTTPNLSPNKVAGKCIIKRYEFLYVLNVAKEIIRS